MSARSEASVLCEGYDDRAFWAGWLAHLGCSDMSEGGKTRSVVDPWGKRVASGEFGYLSASKRFIRIIPCEGESRVLDRIPGTLASRTTQTLRSLVISLDADADDTTGRERGVRDRIRSVDPDAVEAPSRRYTLSDGTRVDLVLWTADGADTVLPTKQTLERLVCTALHAAYPTRAPHVDAWLRARPVDSSPPELTLPLAPKAHAWSHVAGWYPDKGLDAFYKCLWEDPAIARALRQILETSGAWAVAETLAT
jgi:hypothetical protein